MITPSVQALAELTVRIKVLELEIKTLWPKQYPQSADSSRSLGSALSPPSILSSRSRIQIVSHMSAMSEPTSAYVTGRDQSGESDPQLRISKRGDATCADCSSVPRTISLVPSPRKALCAGMG